MGAAKKKLEAMRLMAIEMSERWDFPASAAEAKAVEEIQTLPEFLIPRYPPDVLAYMRMKPNQCHANARFMQAEDPDGICKHVSGYWPQSGNYVLHSVVERHGELFCVTPVTIGGPDEFVFIPDPDIIWRDEGDYRVAYRKGIAVEPGFRTDPVENKRISEIVIGRIKQGVHPLKAGEPPF